MKIDIERYNKSTMPENAEKYFYGPTGIYIYIYYDITSAVLATMVLVVHAASECSDQPVYIYIYMYGPFSVKTGQNDIT